jgi:hypothetical protein
MAKGNSNSAEELNIAPDLEVLQGEAEASVSTVVSQDEITALLAEMSHQNEDAAAPLESTDNAPDVNDDELSPEEAAIVEESLKNAPDMAPEIEVVPEEPIEDLIAVAPRAVEGGPSFTMDQVLQAASSSTSFSVDEIKNFETEELSEDDAEISELEPEEISEVTEIEASAEQVAEPMVEGSEEQLASPLSDSIKPKTRISLIKNSVRTAANSSPSRPRIPEWVMVAAGVFVSIICGYFLTNMQSHTLERKISGKVSKLDNSLSELTELVEGTNTRLANMDRALFKSEPYPPRVVKENPAPNAHEPAFNESHEKSSGRSETSQNPKDVDHDPVRNESDHSASKEPTEHKEKPQVEPTEPADKGDNFNREALTEGFQSGKILIAGKQHASDNHVGVRYAKGKHAGKRHISHANTTSVRSKAGKIKGNSIRVFLNGKVVSLGTGTTTAKDSRSHSTSAKGH